MSKIENSPPGFSGNAPVKVICGVTYNIYDRHVLYDDVWNYSMVKLSEKYMVSPTGLKKVCEAMRIPTPGRGYWAKKAAGQKVKKTPLPDPENNFIKYGERPTYVEKIDDDGKVNKVRVTKAELEIAVTRKRHYDDRARTIEFREKYNAEISHLKEAMANAEKYEMACKLRNYAEALSDNGKYDEIDWILAKADLIDPTIKAVDPILGKNPPLI